MQRGRSARRRRLKGVQTPTLRVCPEYAYTFGRDAALMAKEYGLKPDPWQALILKDWLARDADGMYAADTCGLSVPRQNGKNGVMEVRELYGLAVEGEKILHTAHEVKTMRKAFDRLLSFFENERDYPELAELVVQIRKANGQEAIVLNNGGSIEFSARTRGAARGYTVDVVIIDEAQELTDEQMEALLPTKAAAPLGNAQVIMMGTPPGLNAPGDVFARTRRNAIAGKADGTCWLEWGVDCIGDVRDESRWEQANPALGYRLTRKAVESEIATMSEDGFARERLGWWQEGGTDSVFDVKQWNGLATKQPPDGGLLAYGVKFSPDGERVSLTAALRQDDGSTYVETVFNRSTRSGSTWLAEWLAEREDVAACAVIDGKSGAQDLIEKLDGMGSSRLFASMAGTGDAVAANAMLLNAVREGRVSHYAQPALDRAVESAQRRKIGSGGGWGMAGYNGDDVTPVESAALAMWGAATTKRDPRRKMRVG